MKKVITLGPEYGTFYTAFIHVYCIQNHFNNPSAEKTLIWLCEHSDCKTREVKLTPKMRKEALTALDISTSHLSNNLEKLKQAELISGSYGDYIISESIHWPVSNLKDLDNKSLQITFTLE